MSDINEDEIPPLEDIPISNTNVSQKPTPKVYSACVINEQVKTSIVQNEEKPSKNLDNKPFAGLKKGFLNSQPSKSEIKSDIIHVKANKSQQNENRIFADIKDAVKESTPSWINDDFLEKIQHNEKLSKGFQNNRLLSKISKFQNNPQEALKECSNDKEAQDFLMEFMKLMGGQLMSDEFNNNNKKKDEPVPEYSDAKNLLQNNEVKQLLLDEDVKRLFLELRTNPENGNRILRSAKGEMQIKIQKLISYGLLDIQN